MHTSEGFEELLTHNNRTRLFRSRTPPPPGKPERLVELTRKQPQFDEIYNANIRKVDKGTLAVTTKALLIGIHTIPNAPVQSQKDNKELPMLSFRPLMVKNGNLDRAKGVQTVQGHIHSDLRKIIQASGVNISSEQFEAALHHHGGH